MKDFHIAQPTSFCNHKIKNTMVAFGEHLKANIAPEYGADVYINYQELDLLIQMLSSTAPSG